MAWTLAGISIVLPAFLLKNEYCITAEYHLSLSSKYTSDIPKVREERSNGKCYKCHLKLENNVIFIRMKHSVALNNLGRFLLNETSLIWGSIYQMTDRGKQKMFVSEI